MRLRTTAAGAVLGPAVIPAGTLISSRSGTGRLVPNCPNCKAWAENGSIRPTAFRMTDGVTHVAPDIWLAGRGVRVEREDGLCPVEAGMQAMIDWAWHCGIENSRRSKS
jgi:hypothetical protein